MPANKPSVPLSVNNAILSRKRFLTLAGSAFGLAAAGVFLSRNNGVTQSDAIPQPSALNFRPRGTIDTSGYAHFQKNLETWPSDASLATIAAAYTKVSDLTMSGIDNMLAQPNLSVRQRAQVTASKASVYNYLGKPEEAYDALTKAREVVEADPETGLDLLYSLIYFQGVSALRRGETENCVMCLGESACILPIVPAAVHKKPDGSRLAIKHFTEYLVQFPEDLEVKWLMNLAYMTLGEYPAKVAPQYLIPLDHYLKSEFNVGKFRNIGHEVGLDRVNQAGGAIMEDFDNDGNLDIIVTSWDATLNMAYYHNKGDGTFEDRTEAAGLKGQLGGLYCVQTDYNNDGHMDIFIARGAWVQKPMRPSLLRNNGDGTFTDVTEKAGLAEGITSNGCAWADYDNDGYLDLFICCEAQPNKLYHNNGDGTFTDVTDKAGVGGDGGFYKGCTWIDTDNNGHPDLFVTDLNGLAKLYRNNGDGTFTDVSIEMGIVGPEHGFSCWAFDYDNDGYLDIFATSYDKSVENVVKGLMGQPHTSATSKLLRNKGAGKGFEDVTVEAGLTGVYATMGSNFGDFDNDGYLDFYLGTGDPNLTTLVPNRMFKNVEGKRFAEITASAGTGNLQKGHGVACGDWDNDGNVDIFIQMGGAVPGDVFRNCLFQNPGQQNRSINVKLVGVKTNRAAIGARIKVVTDGPTPQTIHRHVSSGSSFGANPLAQTIGLGKAEKVATLEVYWPTSKTTQVFHDIPAGQSIEITEFATDYRVVERKQISVPQTSLL